MDIDKTFAKFTCTVFHCTASNYRNHPLAKLFSDRNLLRHSRENLQTLLSTTKELYLANIPVLYVKIRFSRILYNLIKSLSTHPFL